MADDQKKPGAFEGVFGRASPRSGSPPMPPPMDIAGAGSPSHESSRPIVAADIDPEQIWKAQADNHDRTKTEGGRSKSDQFSLGDLVVLISCALFAEPFCHAGADAFLHEHYDKAALGFTIGLPPGIAGGSFHWWKKYLSAATQKIALATAIVLGIAGVVLAFAYVAGPEMYRRATEPQAPVVSVKAPETKAPVSQVDTPPQNGGVFVGTTPPQGGNFYRSPAPDAGKMGPLTTLRIVDSISVRGNTLTPTSNPIDFKWALVMTYPRENEYASLVIRRIVGAKLTTIPIPPPNPNDLDAPKFVPSGQSGVTLHGNNQLNDRLFSELGLCFSLKKTGATPDNLQAWYAGKAPDGYLVDWIDIGPGSPWKEPFQCSD